MIVSEQLEELFIYNSRKMSWFLAKDSSKLDRAGDRMSKTYIPITLQLFTLSIFSVGVGLKL